MLNVLRSKDTVKSVLLAVTALTTLLLSVSGAAPAAPTQRVDFTKEASDATPRVGETFVFTSTFSTTATETQTLQVRVTDPNPAPDYLEIEPDSVTGGATYSPTIDAVVWEGLLFPAGSLPQVIAFQVHVTGMPDSALAAGYLITNTATMVDLATPGSLPEATAEAAIRILPARILLPILVADHGG